MLKWARWFSFATIMKYGLLLCVVLSCLKGFSQDKTLTGIVFEQESKERVASVNIRNITTNISAYNSLKGEFKVAARPGDLLVFSKLNFHSDTIKVQNSGPVAIYMVRIAIQLKEVTVHDSLLTPEQRLEATKNDYTKVYGSLAYNDFLSTSSGGAGLSIDALWNSLSREGRNASRLRQIIERDYEQNAIDYRFNRNFVSNITGLKDEKLTEFMFRYRPGFYTTKTMTDYEFITMIRANYRRFMRANRVYSLQPLQTK